MPKDLISTSGLTGYKTDCFLACDDENLGNFFFRGGRPKTPKTPNRVLDLAWTPIKLEKVNSRKVQVLCKSLLESAWGYSPSALARRGGHWLLRDAFLII